VITFILHRFVQCFVPPIAALSDRCFLLACAVRACTSRTWPPLVSRPNGAKGCSHGWSAAQPLVLSRATRRPGRGGGIPRHPRAIFLLLLSFLSLCLSSSLAQTPPAGNAHPESQSLSQTSGQLVNPFGDPPNTITPTDQKRAFSNQLNLDPLKDLAIFHNGRAKIVDTLARETVQHITGRTRFADYLTVNDKPTEHKYPPLFTFLDLLIDPAYYLDKPLIHVEFLPLRERYLELAFPQDQSAQDRWKRLTRITPVMAVRHTDTIATRHVGSDDSTLYRPAINKVMDSLSLYDQGAANLLLIAPEKPDAPYTHLGALPADHPARIAAAKLATAWRANDAAAANSAIQSLAEELPRINSQTYPTTTRQIESTYNRLNAFEWGWRFYSLALISLILGFGIRGGGRRWLIATGITTLFLAVILHATGFTLRCLIAERFAIQNQFESMTGLSLFGVIVGSAIMLLRRQWLFGAAAAGVGFLILIAATQLPIIPGRFIEREAAILNTSVLLKYHVTTVLCSYGLISLGFIVSLFYLGTHYATRRRLSTPADSGLRTKDSAPFPPPQHPAPSTQHSTQSSVLTQHFASAALNTPDTASPGPARTLHDLDRAQLIVLQLAFWTLGVGILLGAWWADHSWGRFWNFDPKETWALATWIVYLIVIHVRLTTGHNRALVTAWLSVIGFFVMLWTYFGVNLILPGLHAYA
jgi:cytochrome c-type biogenesis protein CcsB